MISDIYLFKFQNPKFKVQIKFKLLNVKMMLF